MSLRPAAIYSAAMKIENPLVSIEVGPRQDAAELYTQLRQVVVEDGKVVKADSAEFVGGGLAELVVVLGSSGMIASVARVLITWINAKKDRTVKINKTELKGYSADDVVRMLVLQVNPKD